MEHPRHSTPRAKGWEPLKSLRAAWLLLVPAALRFHLPRVAALGAAFAAGAVTISLTHKHLRLLQPPAAPVPEPPPEEPKPLPPEPPPPGSSLTLPPPLSYDWGSPDWRAFCARAGTRCATQDYPSGGTVVWGETFSNTLPAAEPAQPAPGGLADAFLARFDAQGHPVFATYLGGGMSELAGAVAVDAEGDLWLSGRTESPDFPTLQAAQDVYGGGPSDGFLAKFSSTGERLFATFLGGPGEDRLASLSPRETGGMTARELDDLPEGRLVVFDRDGRRQVFER